MSGWKLELNLLRKVQKVQIEFQLKRGSQCILRVQLQNLSHILVDKQR